MSLALSTLIYEWRRYMAAMVALAMAGVLTLAVSGFFVGLLGAYTATIDRSRADIMVLMPKVKSLQNNGGFPRRLMPLVYMHPDVVEVRDLAGDGGRFYAEGQPDPQNVDISIIDAVPNAVTLPTDFSDAIRDALAVPFNVAVDRTSLKRLHVKLGDTASLDGKTIRIAAILDGYPNFDQPGLVMSRESMRLMGREWRRSDRVGPLMVKIRSGADAEHVRDELNAMSSGQYRAWTRAELSKATTQQFLERGIIALIMDFMMVLGLIIGTVITWQTLRGAILANVKELASLRALGVSMNNLRLIVVELSFWVGVAGLVLTSLLMVLLTFAAKFGGVPLIYRPSVIISCVILLMVIAIGSGVLTLGVLKKSQPADLLR
jgi:putative ABC transport system permease protein